MRPMALAALGSAAPAVATIAAEPFAEVVQRPDNRHFSERTALLHDPGTSGDSVLYDGVDHTIWRLGIERGVHELAALPLPDNDRAIGLDAKIPRAWALAHGARANSHGKVMLVVGEHGRYQWNGEGFEAYVPSEEFVLRSEADAVRRVEVELADADVFAPKVRVLDPATKLVLYEHQYQVEPSGWMRLAYVCTFLRAPLTTALSFASDGPAQPVAVYVFGDALLIGHARPWLLAASLLVSALVASALIRRRPLGLRWSWVVLILVSGPMGGLVAVMLEPLRARSGVIRKGKTPARLLLQSS